jgi:hypothetical protein
MSTILPHHFGGAGAVTRCGSAPSLVLNMDDQKCHKQYRNSFYTFKQI